MKPTRWMRSRVSRILPTRLEFDPAVPVAAALALRKGMPRVARIPRPPRQQLLRAATAATRHLTRRHGPAAAAAVPAIVHHARRTAARRGLPVYQVPKIMRSTAASGLFAATRRPICPGIRADALSQGRKTLRRLRRPRPSWHTLRRRGWSRPRFYGGSTTYVGWGALHRSSALWQPLGPSRAAGACPHCGRRRSFAIQGPVRITVETI